MALTQLPYANIPMGKHVWFSPRLASTSSDRKTANGPRMPFRLYCGLRQVLLS